ncbi:MAG: pirin family protein [Acidimicrobiales bacterium]
MTEPDPVLQTVPLGFQWPTLDPFLFCVHHDDAYPPGDGRFGPAASLAGRQLGSDFGSRDGWNMYHGMTVPGFPRHPHRGFETVTFVRRGLVDHADSLGAAARFGRGDVQWMTAGAGVVHSEMFPLLDAAGPNRLELFQIWLNLPAADRMVPPYFTMLWAESLPRLEVADQARPHGGKASVVTVLAGRFGHGDSHGEDPQDGRQHAVSQTPPSPPPDSWASRQDADLAIWHIELAAGATITLPPAAGPDTIRTAYLFEGQDIGIGSRRLPNNHAAVLACDRPVQLQGGQRSAELLVLQARPIGEPVAQHGPFVMNDRAEIAAAFEDYQRDGFGGWPWPEDAPVHGGDPTRFARHADGRIERRDGADQVAAKA